MLQTSNIQSCVHCGDSFPPSHLFSHIENVHGVRGESEKGKDNKKADEEGDVLRDIAKTSHSKDGGGDMELDENDEDVQSFLDELDEAVENISVESRPKNIEDTTQKKICDDTNDYIKVSCDICKLLFSKHDLQEHLAKNHDIVLGENIPDDSITAELKSEAVEPERTNFQEEVHRSHVPLEAESNGGGEVYNVNMKEVHENQDGIKALKQIEGDKKINICPYCSADVDASGLDVHISYYHPEVGPSIGPNDADLDVEENLGDVCEMCSVNVGSRNIVNHLAEEHFIRVIMDPRRSHNSSMDSTMNSSLNSSIKEDPFEMPDFLQTDKKVLYDFRCHHCQKRFSTNEKLDKHLAKKHEKRCRVCKIQRLVLENRYLTIMKQLATSKALNKEDIPANTNIVSGEFFNRVFSYEELYPMLSMTCEECEDDFFWPDEEHSCANVTQGIRMLSGIKCKGRPIIDHKVREDNVTVEFDYITSNLAQSQVKKLALDLVLDVVNESIDALIDNVVEGKSVAKVVENEEMTNLQKAVLELTEKFEARNEEVPIVLTKAFNSTDFLCSSNEVRKLLGYFVIEYKETIEEEMKEMFKRRTAERKQLQEDARKEMNQRKVFDYSKYQVPNLKKPKPFLPLQRISGPQMSNEEGNNSFNLPTGGNVLEATGSKTFLNNIRKQQNRTIKVYNNKKTLFKPKPQPPPPIIIPRQSTASQSSMNRSFPVIGSNNIALTGMNLVPVSAPNGNISRIVPGPPAPTSGIKIEPGTLSRPQGPSVAKVPIPQVRKLETKPPSAALQKLQSLGLSVKVKEKTPDPPVATPPVPSSLPPSISTSKVSKSLIPGTTSHPTQPVKRLNSSLPPRNINIPNPKTYSRSPASGPRASVQPRTALPKNHIYLKQTSKGPTKVAAKPVTKVEFDEKQKLMLKSQILAYRMMRRREHLQNVVIQAATNKNFRSLNLPKNDLNVLSSLFKKEYS